jgi:hypothetical protein
MSVIGTPFYFGQKLNDAIYTSAISTTKHGKDKKIRTKTQKYQKKETHVQN